MKLHATKMRYRFLMLCMLALLYNQMMIQANQEVIGSEYGFWERITIINNDDQINQKYLSDNDLLISPVNAATQEFNNTFGFELIKPENKTIFREFPQLKYQILNYSVFDTYSFEYQISNLTHDSGPYTLFDPENDADWDNLINGTFKSYWDGTNETIGVIMDLRNTILGTHYIHEFKQDIHAPSFQIGLEVDEFQNLIPFNGRADFAIISPTVYLEIYDNLENAVNVVYTINNQKYQSKGMAFLPDFEYLFENMTQFFLPEWDNMPEGVNSINFYVNDTAGNPSVNFEISFVKDTIAPRFTNFDSDVYWLQIGDRTLYDFNNPIYNTYDFQDIPSFDFNFVDYDIDVFVIEFSLFHANFSSVDEQYSENFPEYEDIISQKSFTPSKKSYHDWNFSFPVQVWNMMDTYHVKISIHLQDYAGNISHYSFLMVRIEAGTISTLGIVIFFIIFGFSLGTAIFSFGNSIISERIKKKYKPLEKKLKEIDYDLLDVALKPVDHVKSARLVEYTRKFHSKIDLESITTPDLKEFLNSSIQLVDLEEIRHLLHKYKMDPMEQEGFLREMLSLDPDERKEFLQNYMGNLDEGVDEELDEDFDDELAKDFYQQLDEEEKK